MSNRSAVIIRPVLYWALPTREITGETGSQLRDDGTCRLCGHNESADLGFPVTECPYLDCQAAFAVTTWGRCSCCDELLPADVPCWQCIAVELQAAEEARNTVQVAG